MVRDPRDVVISLSHHMGLDHEQTFKHMSSSYNFEYPLSGNKGYEKSLGFDHNLLNDIPNKFKKMVAGNIKIDDILDFKNKDYIIDVSGALEDSFGKKSINKINQFLIEVNKA